MRRCLYISIAIFLCLFCATGWAQGDRQVVIPLSNEYIREWLVLGPFFPGDLKTDFLANAGGEGNIKPQDGDVIKITEAKELTWRRYKTKGYSIDLADAMGYHEHATAYAFCILQSEAASKAQVCFGHANGAWMWINGERVYSRATSASRDESVFQVNLKAGMNHCLIKVVQELGTWALAMRVFPPSTAVVSGIVTDEKGEPIFKAFVRLERDAEEIEETLTDESGSYCLGIDLVGGSYNLSATMGDLGGWFTGIPLVEGKNLRLNFNLRKAISIEGALLMLDSATPHAAVPVEAVVPGRDSPAGRAVARVLSDDRGRYRFVNLKPAQYQLRCQILGGYVYYGEERAGKPESRKAGRSEDGTVPDEAVSLRVGGGRTLRNIDLRFAPFKKGTWNTYNILDGLADNGILAINADSDGVMWFGTQTGVSCYDGKEFSNLCAKDGLAGNWVFDIHVDPDGVIWFGTNGGVSRYDGVEFVNFTTEDGLASDVVKTIHRAPDGSLWFGTGWWNIPGGGVSRYDGKEFVSFDTEDGLADNTVKAICSDSDGNVWFGTWGYGVTRYDGENFTNFTANDGLAGDGIYAIHRAPDGTLWFGTDKGISRYDGRGMGDFPHFVNFTTRDGLVNDRTLCIYSDPDGTIWFGTAGGVSRYDGRMFLNFTEQDGLADSNVESIYRSSDGVIWFGTTGGGISCYDSEAFMNLSERDGLVSNNTHFIYLDPDRTMWIGTEGGVSRYHGRSMGDSPHFVNFTEEDGLSDNFIRSIHRSSDDALWFGTDYGGVSRYDGEEFTEFTYEDGLADNRVLSISRCPDGDLWLGTWGGISRYNGKEFANLTMKDGLANNWVHTIHCNSDDIVWIGTIGGGVSRYDGKEFATFTTKDGLADNGVYAIYQAVDGTFWFGTLGGVSQYDGQTFTTFTDEDGLAHNSVMNIYQASDGALWFGTLGGVSRYDGVIWTSLDTRDGLAGNRVRSIYEDVDGSLWFGTDGGITRYKRSTSRPRVRIASVQAMGQIYTEIAAIPPITVGNYLAIEYNAVDRKTIPEKRQYRYRVYKAQDSPEPEDMSWRNPTKETRFEWIPGESGTYTFEVQAIDRDLNYSEPASISIIISSRPFYQAGIFLMMLTIIGGASLFAVAVLAVQRRRSSRAKEEAERVQSAKMESLRQLVAGVAHRVNSPIGAISSNSDIISRAIGKVKGTMAEENSQETKGIGQLSDTLGLLERMNRENQTASEIIAKIVDNLRRFVRLDEAEWQYADIHEGIDSVLVLMEQEFSDRIRVTKDYGDIPRTYCSPSILNQVFVIMFKNACEAIEDEGEIHIRTSYQGKHIKIEISDTGRGIPAEDIDRIFDPGYTTKGVGVGVGLGLSICYKIIVDEHKGNIEVSSQPGVGTTFIITIPQYRYPKGKA